MDKDWQVKRFKIMLKKEESVLRQQVELAHSLGLPVTYELFEGVLITSFEQGIEKEKEPRFKEIMSDLERVGGKEIVFVSRIDFAIQRAYKWFSDEGIIDSEKHSSEGMSAFDKVFEKLRELHGCEKERTEREYVEREVLDRQADVRRVDFNTK